MSRPGRSHSQNRSRIRSASQLRASPQDGLRPRPLPLPPLLPSPRRQRSGPGAFAWREGLPIVLAPGAGASELAAARRLQSAVREACGRGLRIEGHARSEDLGPRVELRREAEAGEAYRLEVSPERVLVVGAGPAGLRYGVETLTQLLRGGRVPACEIEDAPDFPHRGLMLDVSRGKVPTRATLEGLVDLCLRLKLNTLMLYVEHTFRFRRHPRIGEGCAPLAAETLRALDLYAAERHVELVPCLQSLGHMEHLLRLPEYAELAETERRWTLSPSHPGSYALLADLYAELLPNFRSALFNANCDEPYDLEHGPSAEAAAQLGPGGVFLEHVRRIRDLAKAHGKRTMIWADVVHAHPERIPEIDRDLLLLDWWYEADFDADRVARFAEHGLDFWVCPGTSSWNCLFPRVPNSLQNISRYAEAGRRHGASGLLVTDWGDFGHYNLQGNSWLAFAWAAQQAWSGPVEARSFDRAFSRLVFGEESGGAAARLYRELGSVHEAGFRIFNGSPLQLLFFDDLDEAYFLDGARRAPLRRSLRSLERLRERLERQAPGWRADPRSVDELRYAAEASAWACRKSLAALEVLDWRRRPQRLDARGRRALARELASLAAEQASRGRRLRRLWLQRSELPGFEMTRRRLGRSVASLRRAARALERNRPPSPPPPHPGFPAFEVFRRLKRATEG